MKLEDLMPEKPTFTIASSGKTYELRIPTIEDRVHWGNKFGSSEKIQEIFRDLKWAELCQICYRLLTDKSDFMAEQVEIIDDEGVKKMETVSGPMKLLKSLRSQMEAVDLLKALTSAVMLSEPLVGEHVREEIKKKLQELNQTGPSTSTSSPVSTDTAPTNSETSQTASSPQ